ncbi:hypothetical protein ABB37_05971 [Leptomonas pyrrhocoris]|uniref:Uncharacterized protein n=1 Tax=Leptomonas pyrrhocoris TaxID=157538 RepID=A0A0M9FZ56_LEPPY|nr:hypothetical protein ABB37_05971 [Leptomonas pyrrhocoris]KPA78907.1 hypothetical protein ABB37_05971 [Leptomonas pyrrhocoris]|eukprot:XP_015657346.1 hypothetical protein ABB37_05971 [Leptomonas pyrrhocoris]
MPPGVVAVQPGAVQQAGTPPAFSYAVGTPTQPTAAYPGSATQSAGFAGFGPNATSNAVFNAPAQKPIGAPVAGGAFVPLSASLSGSMTGSGATDSRPVYMMSPHAVPMGYTSVLSPGYAPVGAVPMVSGGGGGGYYSMAVYPPMPSRSSGDFSTSPSGPLFVNAPAQMPAHGASADFAPPVSMGGLPPAFNGAFAPQTPYGALRNELSNPFRTANNRAGKAGNAGRGYEAGVYYEGRVKRFNPVRGYGFLSATHKLVKLKEVKERVAAETNAPAESRGTSTAKDGRHAEHNGEARRAATLGMRDNEKQTGVNQRTTPTSTNPAAAVADNDVPLISIITAAGTEADPEIDLDDVVVIKGEEYVRKPVVMGDIFVHYHCLQRTPEELQNEQSGALVNLPAGARVQFKAEVFVPARLMEEAQDSKQAAAMLNSIGISVDEDPNLLAGAIATKKGWGYQAMNVVQLPSQTAVGHRRRRRGKAGSTGNASTASMSSINSLRRSHTPSHERSEHGENSNALVPCSEQNLMIRVEVANTQPPPPSFESATANMKYAVPTAGGVVYYSAYPYLMPRQQ